MARRTKKAEASPSPLTHWPPVVSRLPEARSPQAAYDFFLAEAESVTDPRVCRADLPIALNNVDVGLASIAPHLDTLAATLPTLDLPWLLSIGDLVRATLFASGLNVEAKSDGEIARQVSAMFAMRKTMLLNAQSLARMKLLPAARVEALTKGKGSTRSALGLAMLVALYRETEAVAGKHPFDDAWMASATTLATWVLGAVRSVKLRTRPKKQRPEARLRDQFWTLVEAREQKLKTVARVLFEDRAKEMVPPLHSRKVTARKA